MARRTIVISGASGFIGAPHVAALHERGDRVIELTRGESRGDRVHWDPDAGELDAAVLEGCDAVVHLAGESIAGVWTANKNRRILDSRRRGTALLAETVAAMKAGPAVFVSSSAIGFYGDRGDEVLGEESGNGDGFLAEVVREWEDAAQPARDAGIRTVSLRIGLVLGRGGGALGPMKTLFKLGAGGKLGSGEQWWSWVALDDVVRAFIFAIDDDESAGAYNVTAPEPVTNAAFTKALARALHRPALFPAPKFALKLTMGEMAGEMLLASQRTDSTRLRNSGFKFEHTDLDEALRAVV